MRQINDFLGDDFITVLKDEKKAKFKKFPRTGRIVGNVLTLLAIVVYSFFFGVLVQLRLNQGLEVTAPHVIGLIIMFAITCVTTLIAYGKGPQ